MASSKTVWAVVIYWPDGATTLVGFYDTARRACDEAMAYKSISDGGKITVAGF